jgi:esterase/lipase
VKNAKKIFLFISCFLLIISCKSFNDISICFDADSSKFFETTVFPVRGIVVLVHGLNMKPSKLGDEKTEGTLVKLFLDIGYHVYRVTLPGAGGTIEEMRNARAEDWLDSALIQYRNAATITLDNDIPVYLAGFSLGALVYNILMNTQEDVTFAGAVLFAPAVSIKRVPRFAISVVGVFLPDSTIIRSVSPSEYRAHKGVSISAYKALFKLEDSLYDDGFANNNIPTLVFINPRDELISLSILRKSVNKFNLTNWDIVTVSAKGARVRPRFHHLIIDDKSVSPKTWEEMRERIMGFLDELQKTDCRLP